ncbi:hypothetical protein RclHR1_06210002 [Rhizophagus clarus]|uniref:F-box domain-containing protein n=1 Tax=Rhizophagus clarus TaxID=94130 RepID=A0A2Z6SHT4_9GLOM|nr:hypothetical protein RclHR1_06210002 [Rhizophagus clarus]
MSKFNKDVLFLIFEELNYDKNSLYSCLLVNRTWCETMVPILWRNPSQHLTTIDSANNLKDKILNVILSHLSKESRENLKNQGIDIFTEEYRRPLFNYINFWKYLDFIFLEKVILSKNIKNFEESKISILRKEILKLFVDKNRNTKFIQLITTDNPDYQLFNISGAEHYFSELETLSIHSYFGNCRNFLKGLTKVCKSIKNFRFNDVYYFINNSGLSEFIQEQKNLSDVAFVSDENYVYHNSVEPFYKSLEVSLIKHANTIQHLRIEWIPFTGVLSCLVNLVKLKISTRIPYFRNLNEVEYLKNSPLPNLKILKTFNIPIDILDYLTKNTNEQLIKISVHYSSIGSKSFIQVIYRNCPNLKYLKLSLSRNANSLIPEFENLLVNCQRLSKLILKLENIFSWDSVLLTLAKSSPNSLVTFEFHSNNNIIKLGAMRLFFDNWKNRNPMSLEVCSARYDTNDFEKTKLENLIREYKVKGIIKKSSVHSGNLALR